MLLRVLLLLSLFHAAVATGDIMVLSSGNRMSGEVRELARGELSFSISGVGTVDVDWTNVSALESAQRLQIELASGFRYSGTLTSVSATEIAVLTDAGRRIVAKTDIVRMLPADAGFSDRLSGDVALGLDFLSANDEIDWTVNGSLEHHVRAWFTDASLSSLLRRRNGSTAQQRHLLQVRVRRLLEERWFVFARGEAEQDDELDLDSRLLVGAGVGRNLLQSNRAVFALSAGLDLNRETFSELESDHVPEIMLGVEWDLFEIGGDTAVLLDARSYHSLDESRVRFALDGKLRHDIAGDYYLSLNVYESYDSDPPPGAESSDLGISLSFGRTF